MKFEEFSAFLFDCDGTIADSMPLHLVAWNTALSRWGGQLPEELHYRWAGRPTLYIVQLLNEMYGLNMPAQLVVQAKENAYLELLPQIKGVPAVVEIIHCYHGKLPFAVVSGSPRDSVKQTLTHLRLHDFFEHVLGAEDYDQGKPAPDCFLEAARRLQVAPEKCLVFEDAALGIDAAVTAGMKWVLVNPRLRTLAPPQSGKHI